MKVSASNVGRVLNKHGLPRASKYSTWGRENDGIGVHKDMDGGVAVYSTVSGDKGQALLDQAHTALKAAGLPVKPSGKRIGRHLGMLEVHEKYRTENLSEEQFK